MSATADQEWEYEYDEEETEDFYIPIDLSNVPKGQKHVDSERRTGHPTLLKSRLLALNAQRGQQQDAPAFEGSNANAKANGEDVTATNQAQIVGLHTENPLVMYNGQLLSLQWASTIGTDMFFTKPHADTESGEQPLRSLAGVDLLAMSSAKLVAKVGRLRPRDDLIDTAVEADAAAVQTADGAVNEDAQETAAVSSPPPTSFLARLNAAKAKRGDSTRLAVSVSRGDSRLVSEVAGSSDVVPSARIGSGDVEMSGT